MTKTIALSSYTIQIGLTLALAAALIFPVFAYASTYAYINTSGNMTYTQANSSADALATAPNLAVHSGVMLVTVGGTTVEGNIAQQSGYLYINASGIVTFVSADSSAEAFADSLNIATHSGVMLISSISDSNMTGDQTAGY